jgi:hypothetical protein
MNSNTRKQLFTWAIVSLTLGLAPFAPEPHIIGKIRWVAGGAVGMTSTDWFDLALHGFPWLVLGYWVLKSIQELVS